MEKGSGIPLFCATGDLLRALLSVILFFRVLFFIYGSAKFTPLLHLPLCSSGVLSVSHGLRIPVKPAVDYGGLLHCVSALRVTGKRAM